jgi:thiamine pyrophosphokinase
VRALLLANGEPPAEELLAARAAQCDLFVCADGAAATALAAGLKPHLVLGDLDSLDAATRQALGDTELLRLSDQDTTDLEKAFVTLLERGVTEVLVLGAGGRRWDHFLANLSVLARYAGRLRIEAEDAWGRLRMLAPGEVLRLDEPVGTTVSLLPLPRAEGVRTRGLRWELAGEVLGVGEREGVSNEVGVGAAEVSYKAGCLAVYWPRR